MEKGGMRNIREQGKIMKNEPLIVYSFQRYCKKVPLGMLTGQPRSKFNGHY
jgi:hypothetical protein